MGRLKRIYYSDFDFKKIRVVCQANFNDFRQLLRKFPLNPGGSFMKSLSKQYFLSSYI
jgi:hypothetical protein